MAQKKYASLTNLQTFLNNLKTQNIFVKTEDYQIDSTLSSTSINPVQNKVLNEEFEAISQAYQALESEIDNKADASHNHDDRYYTETEIDTQILGINQHVSSVDTSVSNIVNGTTKVPKAAYADTAITASAADTAVTATSAASAQMAIKDSGGNQINTYYMKRGSYERIGGTSSAHKNLNDYKTAGFYNVKTQYVDNCPEGIGIDAALLVYPWNSEGYELQELTETAASSSTRRWVRKNNAGVWSEWREIASVDDVQTQLDNKAALSHNHSAANITSGTLSSDRLPIVPVAKGGTGLSSVAANNILVGNGTNSMIERTPEQLLRLIGGSSVQIITWEADD